MKQAQFQAADLLPSRLTQGIFCETDDQLFVALCEPERNVETPVSTIRVYDVAALKGARETVQLGDKKWPKLPMRWEAQGSEVYQSIIFVEGKLLVAGKNTLTQLDAEAGLVYPRFGDLLSWGEDPVKFPDPIYPPIIYGSDVVILSYRGDIFKFHRRTPPRGEMPEPIFSLDGAVRPDAINGVDAISRVAVDAFSPTVNAYGKPGVYIEEKEPAPDPYHYDAFDPAPLPGALVGDMLMYRHDNRIIVYNLRTERLVSDKSLETVSLAGQSYDFLRGQLGAEVHPDQDIIALNGYGFLPFTYNTSFVSDDAGLAENVKPLFSKSKSGPTPDDPYEFFNAQAIRFHLVPGVLIAPNGDLSLPLAGPFKNQLSTFEAVNLFGDIFTKPESYEKYEGAKDAINGLRTSAGDQDFILFNRTECQVSVMPWGMEGSESAYPHYFGEWDRFVLYFSVNEDGTVVFGDYADHLPDDLKTDDAFWRFDLDKGALEKVAIVASKTNLNVRVDEICKIPGEQHYFRERRNKKRSSFVINGAFGRSIAICKQLEFYGSHDSDSSSNVLLLAPESTV